MFYCNVFLYGLFGTQGLSVDKSNRFFVFVPGFCRNVGSKFISMTLVKKNQQNELGDIISEHLVALVHGSRHPAIFC